MYAFSGKVRKKLQNKNVWKISKAIERSISILIQVSIKLQ